MQSSMSSSRVSVAVLVADSGAFIRAIPLEKWSPCVTTVREVVSEVRDEHTRRRLQVLPYKLHIKEPSQEALQHVIKFAKKTGDYGSLSAIDVKVMALTYQLTLEHEPERIGFRVQPAQEELSSDLPGVMPGFISNTSRQPVATTGESSCLDDGPEGESSEEEGWITPVNLADAHAKFGGAVQEPALGIAVGCVTTDFAMQNVLMQMGLTVISVDGMQIKQLRIYAKKCKACFRTTTNTTVLFCPHCGNKTLAKVFVTVGEDGTLRYHFLSTKQFSHKGLRYSLPAPKGGRHANNPVLAPDQKVTYKSKRSRQPAVHPLHPDYIAQASPFAMNDVSSRGAQVFFHGKGRSGRRQNPNAVRPKLKHQ